MSRMSLETLPELAVERICEFLNVNDLGRFAQTCRRLHAIVPKLKDLVIKGDDFSINQGRRDGHYCPKIWFDGPPLPGPVRLMKVSMKWKDQGWGNRKGQVWMQLMRGDDKVAEKKNIFEIAPHEWAEEAAKVEDHDLLKLSKKGDFYRFMRNTGGGGGHSLKVKNFTVLLIWQSLEMGEEAPSSPSHENVECSR